MPHPQGYLLRAARNLPAKARTGLYAGRHASVVNRVSTEYEVRSRKYVKPNAQKLRLWSQGLGKHVQLPVTAAALRAIDRAGGLDRYLLKTPDSLLHSDVGSDLKFRLSLIYRNKLLEQQRQQQRQRGGGSSSSAPRLAAASRALPGGGTSIDSSAAKALGLSPGAAAAFASARGS